MSGLEKATLTRLSNDRRSTEVGAPIPVQFNPDSLRLTLSNQTEGGASRGRQSRQYTGNSSTELAFDLVFDTADEDGGGGEPRDVRGKTARVEQFVLPQGTGAERQSPPRVRFHWGKLLVEGVITSLAIDFDLFAPDGTPLRAKMGVSIKEQDARYELLQAGPGSSLAGRAPQAGGSIRARPGGAGGGLNDPRSNRLSAALGGESAAEFAARVGLDPAAWRGVAAGLGGTLSLEAGVSIGFDASLSAGAGIGVRAGVESGLGASLEASLGLAKGGGGRGSGTGIGAGGGGGAAASGGGSSPPGRAGFALSAAGGVGAAVETVKIAEADAATGRTLQAFGAMGVVASAQVPRATDPATQPAAYAPPRADTRATSFGQGVPLRPRVTGAADLRAGVVALRPYESVAQLPTTRDPTVPPWVRTPAIAPAGTSGGVPVRPPRAGHVGHREGGRTGCGCGCGPQGGRP